MFNYLQQPKMSAMVASRQAGNPVNRIVLKANFSLLLGLSIIPTLNGVALIT
jgi:hypothetical protein